MEVICNSYLVDNFHKFTEANKQRIALSIASKMVTQKTESKTEVKHITPEQSKHLQTTINTLFNRVADSIGN